MSIELWSAFVLASVLLVITPGPTVLTVISYSLAKGPSATAILITAVMLGDIAALALSLLGLGVLLAESAFWFQVVKWAGGLYLIYLGLSMLREGFSRVKNNSISDNLAISSEPSEVSNLKLLTNTFLVTALNPKGIIFFIAFLPQFVSSESNAIFQLWILAATFVLIATINTAAYAIFAVKAREKLKSPNTLKLFNVTGGSLLGAAGLWALTAEK